MEGSGKPQLNFDCILERPDAPLRHFLSWQLFPHPAACCEHLSWLRVSIYSKCLKSLDQIASLGRRKQRRFAREWRHEGQIL